MPGLMADVNIEGQFDALIAVCESEGWRAIWNSLGVTVHRWVELGLERDVADRDLWHACQDRGLILVTANRNADDLDSLQATITRDGTAASLPVVTLSDQERIRLDRAYAELAAAKLMDILIDIDSYRGTGRLWLP